MDKEGLNNVTLEEALDCSIRGKTEEELRTENFNLRLRCYNYEMELSGKKKDNSNSFLYFDQREELANVLKSYQQLLIKNHSLEEENKLFKQKFNGDHEKLFGQLKYYKGKYEELVRSLFKDSDSNNDAIAKLVDDNFNLYMSSLEVNQNYQSTSLKMNSLEETIQSLKSQLMDYEVDQRKRQPKPSSLDLEQEQFTNDFDVLKVRYDKTSEHLIRATLEIQKLNDSVKELKEKNKILESDNESLKLKKPGNEKEILKLKTLLKESLKSLVAEREEVAEKCKEIQRLNDRISSINSSGSKSNSYLETNKLLNDLCQVVLSMYSSVFPDDVECISKLSEKQSINDRILLLKKVVPLLIQEVPSSVGVRKNAAILDALSNVSRRITDLQNTTNSFSSNNNNPNEDQNLSSINNSIFSTITFNNSAFASFTSVDDSLNMSLQNGSTSFEFLMEKLTGLQLAVNDCFSVLSVVDLNKDVTISKHDQSCMVNNSILTNMSSNSSTLTDQSKNASSLLKESADDYPDKDDLFKLYHEEKESFCRRIEELEGDIELLKQKLIDSDEEQLKQLQVIEESEREKFCLNEKNLILEDEAQKNFIINHQLSEDNVILQLDLKNCTEELLEKDEFINQLQRSHANELQGLNESLEDLMEKYGVLEDLYKATNEKLDEKSQTISNLEVILSENDGKYADLLKEKESLQIDYGNLHYSVDELVKLYDGSLTSCRVKFDGLVQLVLGNKELFLEIGREDGFSDKNNHLFVKEDVSKEAFDDLTFEEMFELFDVVFKRYRALKSNNGAMVEITNITSLYDDNSHSSIDYDCSPMPKNVQYILDNPEKVLNLVHEYREIIKDLKATVVRSHKEKQILRQKMQSIVGNRKVPENLSDFNSIVDDCTAKISVCNQAASKAVKHIPPALKRFNEENCRK